MFTDSFLSCCMKEQVSDVHNSHKHSVQMINEHVLTTIKNKATVISTGCDSVRI